MSIDAMREVAHRLLVSTGALAAFGAVLQQRIDSVPVSQELEVRLMEVLRILGIDEELEGVSTEALATLLAEIRLRAYSETGREEASAAFLVVVGKQ